MSDLLGCGLSFKKLYAFKIMPELEDCRFIGNVLKSVDDFLHEGRIFDYIWNQDRYEEGWA